MISCSAILLFFMWTATDGIQSLDNSASSNDSGKAQAVTDYLTIQRQKELEEKAEKEKWRKIQADVKNREKEMQQYIKENKGKPKPNRLYDPSLTKPLDELSKPYVPDPDDLKAEPERKSALERVREKIQEREDREQELRAKQQSEEALRKKKEQDAAEESRQTAARQAEQENKLKLNEHRASSMQLESKLSAKELLAKLKTDQHTFQEAVKHYQTLKKQKQDELTALTAELDAKSKKAM